MVQNSCGITVLDICRKRGDDFPIQLTIKDGDGVEVDITGFSYLLTVDPSSEPEDDTNNLFQISGTLTDPANGVVSFSFTQPDVDQTPDTYYYDIQQTDTGPNVRTILVGSFTFEQDLTK